jgi:hypothetical protein
MSENQRVINPLEADSETTVVAPIFDSTSRQTARMVVPLSSAVNENGHARISNQSFAAQISSAPQNINQPFELRPQYPFIREQIVISQPRRKSFLRYVALVFLVSFALCAGAIGGFALAHYEKKNEAKGIALSRQPALKDIKGLPETIELFEDPNEVLEMEIEETGDSIDPSRRRTITPEEPDSNIKDLPTPDNPSEQRERVTTAQQEKNDQPSPTEQRERKVVQPKQPIADDKRTQQKQTQQKPITTEEYAREQIKRAIERIGKILN